MYAAHAASMHLAALRDFLVLLSRAPVPADVAAGLAAPGLLPMHAARTSLWVVTDRRLVRIGSCEDTSLAGLPPLPDSLPLTSPDPTARAALAATIVRSHSPMPGAPANLRVPIVSRGIVVGVYGTDGEADLPLTADDIMGLEALADALSLWLDRGPDTTPASAAPPMLSRRQQQILLLVLAGSTNTSIAAALACSVATVKVELRTVNRLLGTTERRSAALNAAERGLLVPDDAR